MVSGDGSASVKHSRFLVSQKHGVCDLLGMSLGLKSPSNTYLTSARYSIHMNEVSDLSDQGDHLPCLHIEIIGPNRSIFGDRLQLIGLKVRQQYMISLSQPVKWKYRAAPLLHHHNPSVSATPPSSMPCQATR